MDNIEFDFGDFYPRNNDEKLENRDKVKNIRNEFFDEKKKEMRMGTRNKEKERRKEHKEKLNKLTEGNFFIKKRRS
jgi:hypothetical protein